MLNISAKFKKLAILALAFLLGVVILQTFKPAQASSMLDTRVSRVESEISQLRSQMSRLEGQVYRLNNQGGTVDNSPRVETPQPVYTPPQPIPDQMFERLATLVIELRDQVNQIDARLREVENTVY